MSNWTLESQRSLTVVSGEDEAGLLAKQSVAKLVANQVAKQQVAKQVAKLVIKQQVDR